MNEFKIRNNSLCVNEHRILMVGFLMSERVIPEMDAAHFLKILHQKPSSVFNPITDPL
jgi:hypothetical protein